MVDSGVDVTRKAGTIDVGRPHSKERTLIAGSNPAYPPIRGEGKIVSPCTVPSQRRLGGMRCWQVYTLTHKRRGRAGWVG